MSNKRLLPDDVAISRGLSNLRVAASASFPEAEVLALDEILTKLLRGAPPRISMKSPIIGSLLRKIGTMKIAIERQKTRRALSSAGKTSAEVEPAGESDEGDGTEGQTP